MEQLLDFNFLSQAFYAELFPGFFCFWFSLFNFGFSRIFQLSLLHITSLFSQFLSLSTLKIATTLSPAFLHQIGRKKTSESQTLRLLHFTNILPANFRVKHDFQLVYRDHKPIEQSTLLTRTESCHSIKTSQFIDEKVLSQSGQGTFFRFQQNR